VIRTIKRLVDWETLILREPASVGVPVGLRSADYGRLVKLRAIFRHRGGRRGKAVFVENGHGNHFACLGYLVHDALQLLGRRFVAANCAKAQRERLLSRVQIQVAKALAANPRFLRPRAGNSLPKPRPRRKPLVARCSCTVPR